jgi:hypothetical protein
MDFLAFFAKRVSIMAIRKWEFNLCKKDSEYLEEIAKQLGLTESEVICKGLKFMALYAKTQTEKDTRLIIEKDGNQKQIIV